ncbi:beta-2-microglobulin-like [Astyanax mexicanus]|uniref:Beta-2-microglobulin-like n=1 Tax=Astyanax mexicanus TaxID=7994 RepID=A0A8T2LFW9_ASTMX|nr:beta-2-microglobulin-like [Astyanax mexicanus]
MKLMLFCVVFAFLGVSSFAKESPPKVQVYSRNPGEFGKDNVLICHVSGFHPPDITIDLLENGTPIPNAKQTDLAFEQGPPRLTTGSQMSKPISAALIPDAICWSRIGFHYALTSAISSDCNTLTKTLIH